MHSGEQLTVRPSTTSRWTDCARRAAAHSYPELVTAAGFTIRQIPSHCGAVVGTAVHAGGAALNKEKMETGLTAGGALGYDAGAQSLIDELEKGDVAWDAVTRNRNDAHRAVTRMIEVYRQDIAEKLTPMVVEQRLESRFGDNITISGQMDNLAIFPNGPHDTKTGVKSGWNVCQYGCYSALARAHGHRVETVIEDFIQRVSPRQEQPRAVSMAFDRGDCERAAKAVLKLIRTQVDAFLETGDPWSFPANPNSMLCSDRFCRAFGTKWCSAWKEKIR